MRDATGDWPGRPRQARTPLLRLGRRRPPPMPEPSRRDSVLYGDAGRAAAGAGLAVIAGALTGERLALAPPPPPSRLRPRRRRSVRRALYRRAAQLLHGGAGLLALAGTADSALEHYEAHYENRFMWVAPVAAGLGLAAAVRGALHRSGRWTRGVYGALALTGLSGLGFHLYNVGKRPGGFSWTNLFYAAPLGAPGTMLLSGLFGLAGQRLERREPVRASAARDTATGRALAGLAAAAMLGTVAEVALLHFRGAWQNRHMLLPVTIPPAAALALAAAAVRPGPATLSAARVLSGATAVLGVAGVAFHAYGIHRNMGGWGNWSQMILQGPPLPAPPGFTGVALAGLGALLLLDTGHRDERRRRP